MLNRRMSLCSVCWLAVSFLATASARAEEFEQHHAHEHGKLELNVALEDRTLTIGLDSPAVNIVGFEHKPVTPEDKATLQTISDELRAGTGLFGVPAAARCRKTSTTVQPPRWHDHHQHGADSHADFEATFVFDCAAPDQLEWLEFWLLERLRNVREARVNVVTGTGQRSQSVTQPRARVRLR